MKNITERELEELIRDEPYASINGHRPCEFYNKVMIGEDENKYSPICENPDVCQYKRNSYCLNKGYKKI